MAKKRRTKKKSHAGKATHHRRRKGRKGHRRKKGGLGSIITFRTVGGGMGALEANVMLPLLFGGGVAATTVALIRRFMPMDEGSQTGRKVVKYAPVLGLASGILASYGYGMVTKRKADTDFGVASAIVMSAGLFVQDQVALKSRAGDIVAALHGIGAVMPEMAGIGALVMENAGMRGVTLLEAANGGRPDSLGNLGSPYGAQLGVGSLDMSAFGTNSF